VTLVTSASQETVHVSASAGSANFKGCRCPNINNPHVHRGVDIRSAFHAQGVLGFQRHDPPSPLTGRSRKPHGKPSDLLPGRWRGCAGERPGNRFGPSPPSSPPTRPARTDVLCSATQQAGSTG